MYDLVLKYPKNVTWGEREKFKTQDPLKYNTKSMLLFI